VVRLAVPTDFPAGQAQLSVALLSPYGGEPAIRLANEGRQEDGWYLLGGIAVDPARGPEAQQQVGGEE